MDSGIGQILVSYFNYKVKTNAPLKTTIDLNCMLMYFKMFSTS